jgi:hypothetical protein
MDLFKSLKAFSSKPFSRSDITLRALRATSDYDISPLSQTSRPGLLF